MSNEGMTVLMTDKEQIVKDASLKKIIVENKQLKREIDDLKDQIKALNNKNPKKTCAEINDDIKNQTIRQGIHQVGALGFDQKIFARFLDEYHKE